MGRMSWPRNRATKGPRHAKCATCHAERRICMTLYRPIIIGLHGTELSPSEISWLDNLRPYGVILFSRNVENQVQLQALCRSIRKILGNDVVIMVDQEGGRVQRLKSPNWPRSPLHWISGNSGDDISLRGSRPRVVLDKSLALNWRKWVSHTQRVRSLIYMSREPVR